MHEGIDKLQKQIAETIVALAPLDLNEFMDRIGFHILEILYREHKSFHKLSVMLQLNPSTLRERARKHRRKYGWKTSASIDRRTFPEAEAERERRRLYEIE